jgi:hypothetical protein
MNRRTLTMTNLLNLTHTTAIRDEIDKDFTARHAPTAGVTVSKAPTYLSSSDRT